MKRTITIHEGKFLSAAKALIAAHPRPLDADIPQVALLLFVEIDGSGYRWYGLTDAKKLQAVVTQGIDKLGLLPIGCVIIKFEKRSNGRIYLADEPPAFVDSQFDTEEVLRGTVPYFMAEKFGYDMADVQIIDVTKN